MSYPTGNNHSTLSWVKKELDETLRQAAEALEIYSQDARDATHLQFCGSHLHQVHGILRMLELFGAAMLVEEMEQVVAMLLQGEARQEADALQVLMQAILQLGDYLERVQGGLRDVPILLLPLLNDLRAVRNVSLLTEHALFSPDLSNQTSHRSRPAATSEPLAQAARRLRSQFQLGLLGLLRQQDVAASLARMRDVLDALDAAAFDASVGDLWWIASGLVEAVQQEGIDNPATVKMLLGQVDREIRRAAEQGEAELVAAPRQELVKNLLYYVARADSASERVAAIQAHYGLKQLLLDEQQLDSARRDLAAPSRDTLQTVAAILKDDLITAKDNLDLFARSGFADQERLPALAEGLQQVADTLGVLGLGEPRQVIRAQIERIESLHSDAVPAAEAAVMEIAEALLQVEAAIDGFSTGAAVDASAAEADTASPLRQLPAAEYHAIYGTALGEAVVEIGRLKEAVIAMLEAGSGEGGADVAARLTAMAGAMRMLEQPEVGGYLAALSEYAAANLSAAQPLPDQTTQDALADVLAGVEYYLEVTRDGHTPPPTVLEMVRAALGKLGVGAASAGQQLSQPGGEHEPEAAPEWAQPAAAVAAQPLEQMPDQADVPEEPALAVPAPGKPGQKLGRVDYSVPVLGADTDPDILEIFIEEAGEVLETLQEEFPRWRANADNTEALITVRRMYHTLKGSGRLAGALLLGEMAWCVESLLNRVLDGAVEVSPAIHHLIEETITALPALIEQIQGGPAPQVDIHALMRRAEALAYPELSLAPADESEQLASLPAADFSDPAEPGLGAEPLWPDAELQLPEAVDAQQAQPTASDEPPQLTGMELTLADTGAAREQTAVDDAPAPAIETEPTARDVPFGGLEIDLSLDAEEEPAAAPYPLPAPAVEPGAGGMDPVLYDIFSRETADHLAVVTEFIASARQAEQPQPVTESLIRALHTLTGSARMADVDPIAQIGRKLELLAEHHLLAVEPMSSAELEMLAEGVELVQHMVQLLAMPAPQWPPIEPLLSQIEAAIEALAARIEAAGEPAPSGQPQAAPVELEPLELDLDLAALFLEEAEDILRFLDLTVERWESELDHDATLAELHRSLHTLKGGARLAGFDAIGTLCHALESLAVDVANRAVPADDTFFNLLHGCVDQMAHMVAAGKAGLMPGEPEELLAAIAALRGSTELIEEEPLGESPDTELVEVFLEEAAEILEATEAALTQWQDEPDNSDRILDLQRALHTLKGGARMAGFAPIADLSHALETLLVAVQAGEPAITLDLFDLLERIYDRLHSQREQAAAGSQPPAADDLLADIAAFRSRRPDSVTVEEPLRPATGEPLQEDSASSAVPVATPPEQPAAEPTLELTTAARDSAEVVRVRADLLDNMVNLAGEVSIYRARLEQQVGAMRFNLGELEQTVARLREQLRTMEIETEAQILYRFDHGYGQADPETDAEFDPLELDRFSRMQELSRALSESTNDLLSIQGLLDNLTRESETLLLQQSRVNTELQDGLMRTRMVPFANLVPRLRRIVRQTCHELGRKAQLKVLGARGEMDRTVLERVTAPLEHMLRNAVAHGIEPPQARLAAGKAEEGEINVTLSREGADVVIRVSDDGSGLHLENIRRKAIEQGLMPADAPLSEREVMQFILEAGFSTSAEVTQIAGRGVGLDVVASEIKQLGGTLEIDSVAQAGTTFTIRLPFTLAVNQALLCQAGEEVYAIPITSIEGVVRMTHEELEHFFSGAHAAYYDYAGARYEVRGLSSLLGLGEPQLPGPGGRCPVILVQTGDHRLAIQVEALLGSREIVVKSVGPQISTVPGIYGATILADGRVVLILDVSSLVRLHLTAPAGLEPTPLAAEAEGSEKVTVMVVDDSITMRKVATRLLERNGMAVITAKDGVDAVARLQETVPAAMLLDIEMPRMDGYELATHMRNDERLQHVPIIMITSRTSEKHRERAFEIGVNRYLGKPYQEAELLENLHEVLEESGVQV